MDGMGKGAAETELMYPSTGSVLGLELGMGRFVHCFQQQSLICVWTCCVFGLQLKTYLKLFPMHPPTPAPIYRPSAVVSKVKTGHKKLASEIA